MKTFIIIIMSNDTVYSKQILDTSLKDGCEKVTTIFHNVTTTLPKTPSNKGGEKVSSRGINKK